METENTSFVTAEIMISKRRRITVSGKHDNDAVFLPNVTTSTATTKYVDHDNWLGSNSSIISNDNGSWANGGSSGYIADANHYNTIKNDDICSSKFFLPEDYKPRSVDVLIGRGKRVSNHSGNHRLRSIVKSHLAAYSSALYNKRVKSDILCSIIKQVCDKDEGLFLKQDMSNYGRWYVVGNFLAKEKISQMFRDALGTSRNGSSVNKREESDDSNSSNLCSTYKSSYSNRRKRKIGRKKKNNDERFIALQFQQKRKNVQDWLHLMDNATDNKIDHFNPNPVIETPIEEQSPGVLCEPLNEFLIAHLQPSQVHSSSANCGTSSSHKNNKLVEDENRNDKCINRKERQQQIMHALLLKNIQLAEAAAEAAAALGEEQSHQTFTSPLPVCADKIVNYNNEVDQELEEIDLCGLGDTDDSLIHGNENSDANNIVASSNTELFSFSDHKNTLKDIKGKSMRRGIISTFRIPNIPSARMA